MTRIGFPHSDIFGSMLTSSSPKLFAGSRVFHRLLVPRHSLYALINLTLRKFYKLAFFLIFFLFAVPQLLLKPRLFRKNMFFMFYILSSFQRTILVSY